MEKWPTVVHVSTILEVQTSGCHASLITFILHINVKVFRKTVRLGQYNPNGCAVRGVGLQSLAGIVGSNPTGGMEVCLLSDVHCQVEVSASGRSLVQSSPTKCGVSECDHEASVIRRPGPLVAVAPWWRWGRGGCEISQWYWGWPFSAVYSSLHYRGKSCIYIESSVTKVLRLKGM
jgi:hypothetical protein